MRKLFGTDGVRGVANETLTPELAFELGRAGSCVLTKERETKNNFIIIGKDTRQSGDMLEAALSAGICSLGVDVWNIGVAPTPVVAWLVKKFQALSGVVISASHNPAKDNGIKFFNNKGGKLDDELELEIEKIIESGLHQLPRPVDSEIGRIYYKPEISSEYIHYLKSICTFPVNKLKVGLDTANGANYKLASEAYTALGISHTIINNTPDGKNINHNCGSTHLEGLKELVLNQKLDIGIAYDGDADRCLAVDENGEEVHGDEIMYICAKYLPALASNKVIVATIMSNFGFELAVKELGKDFIRANVGDRYVSEEMVKTGAKMGGEQSGHIIFPDLNTTGDGLLSSLMLLEAVQRSGKTLGQLKGEMKLFPQVLINVQVKDKKGYSENAAIKAAITEVESKLGSSGRVLVRPSGTEPKIRVMIEGQEQEKIEALANEIAGVIKAEL